MSLFVDDIERVQKKKQDQNPNENNGITNGTTGATVQDIQEGTDGEETIMTNSLDCNALQKVIHNLHTHYAGREQLQIRLSSIERKEVEEFLNSIDEKILVKDAVSIPKLYRYATTFLVARYPEEFREALGNALKKREDKSILE